MSGSCCRAPVLFPDNLFLCCSSGIQDSYGFNFAIAVPFVFTHTVCICFDTMRQHSCWTLVACSVVFRCGAPLHLPCAVVDLHLALPHICLQALSEVCAVCNDAHIEYKDGRYHAVGAPTEAALVVLVEKLGVADAGLNTRIRQQRADIPEGHADGTCQAYCRRSDHQTNSNCCCCSVRSLE